MSLIVNNICKSYNNKLVVDNVSFNILKPGIIGLLGTNGAGKTTIIRIILGILSKDSGSVFWNDSEININNLSFSYLPEERGLYPKTKIYSQFMFFAKLKRVSKEKADKQIEYWLKRLNIYEYKYMYPNQLSKGNQQKIQLIIALLGDPTLLILDEPFSGLDPVNTELLKDVILELSSLGKYIIFCSHQMAMVETFCDNVIIINKGKVVLSGNLELIKNSYDIKSVCLETNDDISFLNLNYDVISVNLYKIYLENKSTDKILKLLLSNNVTINKFYIDRPTLNDLFLEMVGDSCE